MPISIRKSRLTCLIITAINLCFLLAPAIASPSFELQVRLENPTSGVIAPTRLCGMRPLSINAVPFLWVVKSNSSVLPTTEQYCLPVRLLGPYQSQILSVEWVPIKPVSRAHALPAYHSHEAASEALVQLASTFAEGDADGGALRIHAWLVENIKFVGIRRSVEGVEYALRNRQGDCTEHMLLAAELLERNGYLVRRVLGVLLDKDQLGIKAQSLHNWVEYLDNEEWRIFDSTRRFSVAEDGATYIALWHYSDSSQLPMQSLSADSPQLKLYLQ